MSGFGKRLRELRTSEHLTQTEFGAKFNLSKQTISGYENGDNTPSIETLQKFADFFKVSTDYLLGRTDDPTPHHDKTITIAAHRTDDPTRDLPPEALKSIEEFKQFIRLKYGKKPADK